MAKGTKYIMKEQLKQNKCYRLCACKEGWREVFKYRFKTSEKIHNKLVVMRLLLRREMRKGEIKWDFQHFGILIVFELIFILFIIKI